MTDFRRLAAGPLVALITLLLCQQGGMAQPALITLGITALCITWWILEALPMAAVALVPLALFPLFGVLDKDQVAEAYGSSIILLMLGGFILSKALQRSGTHYQLALIALHTVGGGSERRLVIGFMLASAMLSMWISNTATTLMLLPVAMAVLQGGANPRLAVPLMLGIAYAASIGGVGTPVGTPPNLIFMQVYEEITGQTVSFLQWMLWGLPVVLIMLPLAMAWITRGLNAPLAIALPAQLQWTSAQRRVMAVFAITVLAWVTRQEPFGGWSALFGVPGASDAVVALLGAVALFIIPDDSGDKLMDWETASTIPWHILLLFSAGIVIATAFGVAGISESVAQMLQDQADLPLFAVLLALCLAVTLLTEATSNMATATLLMPLLGAAAIGMGLLPEQLMVPAAISASCAFMLPIATAPNAIVYATGDVHVSRMVREGAVLSMMGALVIACCSYFLI